MTDLAGIFETLGQLVFVLRDLVVQLLLLVGHWWLFIAWFGWWLFGVNWTKVWPALRTGAWAPAVLLMVVSALVWSRIAPSDCTCLGFTTVPNFWWQLGAVGLLAALTLFCGWLQGLMNWAPAEINLDPPAPTQGDHGHHH